MTSDTGSGGVVTIREATEPDWPAIWDLFQTVIANGDVFAYDTDTPELVARKLWFEPPATAFVVEENGSVIGTYYVRPNQPGRGAHVANAGYIVAEGHRGRGLARALCEHSLETARRAGFLAVQFNYVVSTNSAAVHVWQKCGFAIVGRLPRAFRHEGLGLVDVFVMHREL